MSETVNTHTHKYLVAECDIPSRNFRGMYSVKHEHKISDLCNETKRARQLTHMPKGIGLTVDLLGSNQLRHLLKGFCRRYLIPSVSLYPLGRLLKLIFCICIIFSFAVIV